jgi:shikimate kinase
VSPEGGPLVVLVGAAGSGKTTVGKRLALRWRVGFRDTDHDVQDAERRSVSDIFVDDGEAYFREREHEAVRAALATHRGVLALGGGAVLDPRNRELMRGHTVVFLKVGLADAASRVGLGQGRPLLLGNVRARMKALLDERLPLYLEVADVTVETDGRAVDEVVEDVDRAVAAHIRARAGEPPARPHA